MSPAELLAELRRRGVELIVVDDHRLHWSAPQGALSLELRRALLAQQEELIALLRSAPAGGPAARPIPLQAGPAGTVQYAHLAFWRWLIEAGRLDTPPAGPEAGPYAPFVAAWRHGASGAA